jgi:hypothetical protein
MTATDFQDLASDTAHGQLILPGEHTVTKTVRITTQILLVFSPTSAQTHSISEEQKQLVDAHEIESPKVSVSSIKSVCAPGLCWYERTVTEVFYSRCE